jgi:uncharacterized protein (TIGR02145 family)
MSGTRMVAENPLPALTVNGNSRNCPGTVTLTASSSPGAVIEWYVAIDAASSVHTGASYTTPEIATSTTYYVQARNESTGCSSERKPVVAEVITEGCCPYTGSDLLNNLTHLCRQRPGGAQNWEAYITDSRDSKIYRIVKMPDNKWWLAQNVKYASVGKSISGCTEDQCGRAYTCAQVYASYAGGTSGSTGNVTGICPPGWLLPVRTDFSTLITSIGTANIAVPRLLPPNVRCSLTDDFYGWRALIAIENAAVVTGISNLYTNDAGREDGFRLYPNNSECTTFSYDVANGGECSDSVVRCFRIID